MPCVGKFFLNMRKPINGAPGQLEKCHLIATREQLERSFGAYARENMKRMPDAP